MMGGALDRASAGYRFFVVGAFPFPHGDASAQRLLTLAQAADAGGHRALIVNEGMTKAPEGYVPGEVATVDGVDYVCLPGPTGGRARRLLHRVTRPIRIGRILSKHRPVTGRPLVSVASGLCSLGLILTLRLGYGVSVVADVVERHDASQFPKGRLDPYFVRHRWTSMLVRRLADGVIVISSRLAAVFEGSARPLLVVPPLVDLDAYAPPAEPLGRRLDLVYVGNPRGKDQLGVLFDACARLEQHEQALVRVTVAGADAAALADNPDVGPARVAAMGDRLDALGYVTRPVVLDLLARADLSVLIRPMDGYAQAGFPSKVPESLAAGCPVLCNLTTDLADYLVDGENAIVCPAAAGAREVAVDDLATTVRRALALTTEEKMAMKIAARRSADSFSTAKWGTTLVTWLEGAA